MRRLWMTGLGLGYAPVASGTFGSAGACAIALIVWLLLAGPSGWAAGLDVCWIVLALLACVGCVAWGPWASEHFAGRCRKQGDPGQVVLDEWAGQWVALVAIPMVTLDRALAVLAVQFLLFRVFDVIKPPPGRQMEKLHGGWGILLDDVVAGLYANFAGQMVFRWLWIA